MAVLNNNKDIQSIRRKINDIQSMTRAGTL